MINWLAFEGFPTDQVLDSFFNTLEKLIGLGYNEEQSQVINTNA